MRIATPRDRPACLGQLNLQRQLARSTSVAHDCMNRLEAKLHEAACADDYENAPRDQVLLSCLVDVYS